MNITQNKELINKVIELSKRKATGSPVELAYLLGVSQRNLYRVLDSIKDSGKALTYSRTLRSYILE